MAEAPRFLEALIRLKPKLSAPIILNHLLDQSSGRSAAWLKLREKRLERRRQAGLKKASRRLAKRKPRLSIPPAELASLLQSLMSTPLLPASLNDSIRWQTPVRPEKLAGSHYQKAHRGLVWLAWKKAFRVAAAFFAGFMGLIGVLALTIFILVKTEALMPLLIQWSVRDEIKKNPGLGIPARAWEGVGASLPPQPAISNLFQSTNIWRVHLKLSSKDYQALSPHRVKKVPLFNKDRTINLLNPNSRRNGLAGVVGYETDWVHGNFEFAGQAFSNVAVRYRGNGTFLNSMRGEKRPFKVDLNKFVKKQTLAGLDTLNFNNLVEDSTYLHDALGYELFRRAGVPATRTAFAWIDLSVAGKWEKRPLGLYAMVENVDEDFAGQRFGSKKTAIFKPVTYDLFKYLGPDWSAYERIYDLKTEADRSATDRVIEFARLFSHSTDEEFSARLSEFLDLEEFARFLSCVVLLSSYDGFLSNGQNYYVYLDPKSNRFGFLPWDLDHAWGDFYHIGSAADREQASIWQPWSARHPFLERVIQVEAFREIYRRELGQILTNVFLGEWMEERMMEVAAAIDEAVQADSAFRHDRFQRAISENWREVPVQDGRGANRPVNPLRGFISRRAESVREQLEGKSEGVLMRRSH